MSRNVALLVAYDGTDFHGWQTQAGQRTVQQTLEDSLRRVIRHPVALAGCGRTDAGVHAAGHVSNFHTTSTVECGKLRHAIGSRLPADLSVLAAWDVDSSFNATRSAESKLYRYRIHAARTRPTEHGTQRRTLHIWEPLDVANMQFAARHMVGTMDFSAMAAAGTKRATMVRTVIRCDVERHLDEIRIDVQGDGFLYKQVRNMVGTLLRVGRGKWKADRVAGILESRERGNAGATAAAHGLSLQWVRYPAHLMKPSMTMEADLRAD